MSDSVKSTVSIFLMSDSGGVLGMFGVLAGKTFGCVGVSSEIFYCCSSTMTLDSFLTISSSLKNKSFIVRLIWHCWWLKSFDQFFS